METMDELKDGFNRLIDQDKMVFRWFPDCDVAARLQPIPESRTSRDAIVLAVRCVRGEAYTQCPVLPEVLQYQPSGARGCRM